MLEAIQTSFTGNSHPWLLAVLIALGVFVLAGLVYTVEYIINGEGQDADAAKFDKIKKKSNIREKSDGSVGYP